MCAMLAALDHRPVAPGELAAIADGLEALMVSVQTGGLRRGQRARWVAIESRLAAVIDDAIVSVPEVARRLVAAGRQLSRLLGAPGHEGDADEAAVEALETLLECLAAYEEGAPVGEDRSTAELVLWLAGTLGISQQAVAELVDVSLRTVQRWLRGGRVAAEDDARVRRLARLVSEMRFALTPAGTLAWLRRPSPYLDGVAPAALATSTDPGAGGRLERLAATIRYG